MVRLLGRYSVGGQPPIASGVSFDVPLVLSIHFMYDLFDYRLWVACGWTTATTRKMVSIGLPVHQEVLQYIELMYTI